MIVSISASRSARPFARLLRQGAVQVQRNDRTGSGEVFVGGIKSAFRRPQKSRAWRRRTTPLCPTPSWRKAPWLLVYFALFGMQTSVRLFFSGSACAPIDRFWQSPCRTRRILGDCWLSFVDRFDAELVLGFLSLAYYAAALPKRSARARHFVFGAHGLRTSDLHFRLCVYRAECLNSRFKAISAS